MKIVCNPWLFYYSRKHNHFSTTFIDWCSPSNPPNTVFYDGSTVIQPRLSDSCLLGWWWSECSMVGARRLKETKMFLPHPRVEVSIVGSLRDREVACSASDRQGLNFESCVWRTVSSQSSHHPREVLLAQFSLYVHKGGLKPDSFHFHGRWGFPSLDFSWQSQARLHAGLHSAISAAYVIFIKLTADGSVANVAGQ